MASAPRDAAFWRGLIAHGREKTLMPAFAQSDGGPLQDTQIESLVESAPWFTATPTTAVVTLLATLQEMWRLLGP